MKNTILVGMFALMAVPAAAQFQVGDAQIPTGGRAGALKTEDLNSFKQSTTVFVLQQGDAARIEMFRKSLADVWTITPFRVVLPDSARYFQSRHYSVFNFGGYTIERRSSSGMVSSSTHLSYDLTIPDFNKRGEPRGRTILGRFILGPDFTSVQDLSRPRSTFEGRNARNEREERESDRLSNSARYMNWGPGQIRGYIKSINDFLAAGERRGILDEITERDALKTLGRDTLYLPQYLNSKMNPLSGAETAGDDGDDNDDSRKAYPFPQRYVSSTELEELLVNASKPVYHLIYVRSAPYKYVSVVEARSGKVIYSRLTNLSYNFRMKDLKALAKHAD